MASRAETFGWLAVRVAAIVWMLCECSAAQSRDGSVRVATYVGHAKTAGLSVSAAGVPGTADAVLEEMTQAAGVIFAGQVTAVRRPAGFAGSDGDAGTGIVEVDFRVDTAVLGPAAGSVYTLREWSGLWSASGGGARYRVGQRVLVFLYEPDAHGLSSPVQGLDGAVPLRGGGVAPGPEDTAAAAAQWMVDLRWVQARALRGGALVMPTGRRPLPLKPIRGVGFEEAGMLPGRAAVRGAMESETDHVRREPLPVPVSVTIATPVDTEPLTQVIALCQKAMLRRVDAGR